MTQEHARSAVCTAVANVIAQSGLSGYALAKRADITEGAISLYRNGKQEPSALMIAKMELAMGVPRGTVYAEAARILSTRTLRQGRRAG